MKILKNILALSAIASLSMSVSAAVVNFSWTGAGGTVATGSINIPSYAGNGTYTSGTLTSFSINATPVTLASPLVMFSFDLVGAGGSITPGDDFTLINNGGNDGLVGTKGLAGSWSLQFDGSEIDNDGTGVGDTDLTLTVVPEPETYAAVAGAGLVAFGLFRRRATKA